MGKKWSNLPVADALTGTEITCVAQDGESRQTTPDAYTTLASGVIVPLAVAAATASILPITNAKLATMAQATVKGRAAGAGAGLPTDLSQAQLTALITALVNSQLADMAQTTVKGRAAGAITGPPQDLTQAQLTELINVFADGLSGAVPAPTEINDFFLRDDRTWQPAVGINPIRYDSFEGTINLGTTTSTSTFYYTKVGSSSALPPESPLGMIWIVEAKSLEGLVVDEDIQFILEGIPPAIQPGMNLYTSACVITTDELGPTDPYLSFGLFQTASSIAFRRCSPVGGISLTVNNGDYAFDCTRRFPAGWSIRYPIVPSLG